MTVDLHRSSLQVLTLLALAMLVACSGQPRQISGQLPLVSLDGLGLDGELVQFDLGIRNINDRPLELTSLFLQLELDGQRVTGRDQRRLDLSVAARGREVVRLESSVDVHGRRLLEALGAGERMSLAYRLELEFDGQRQRELNDTIIRGFLHNVPGQPGRYR